MKARPAIVTLVLMGVYFALRLPHLRDQPIFFDEAIYLRWAQMIAEDPAGNLFVSMQDAKMPLHYWLMALVRPLSGDPVYAGRLLSVLLGALTIPAVMGLCGELGRVHDGKAPGDLNGKAPDLHPGFGWGVMAAAMMICCPLVVMNQRMALAEPLLLLEAVVIGWLSLRFARRIAEGKGAGALALDGVVLGLVWGATLLTKQNFSYLLWVLPPTAMVAVLGWGSMGKGLKRFVPGYLLATGVGLACFVPMLLVDSPHDLYTKLFYKPMFTVDTMQRGRLELIVRNVAILLPPNVEGHFQWWPYDARHPLDGGWLYLYLTPPVLAMGLAAIPWMVYRRQWRVFGFLGVWCGMLLGTLIVGGQTLYSRYALVGAFGLVLAAAWMGMDWVMLVRRRRSRIPGDCVAVALGIILLAWPAAATIAGIRDWRAPVMAKRDVDQYLTGSGAGTGAEAAVRWVKERAATERGGVTVITRFGLGLADDLAWLMLKGEPNVQLVWDEDVPPLARVVGPGEYMLGREQWVPVMRGTRIEPGQRVFMLLESDTPAETGLLHTVPDPAVVGHGAKLVKLFENMPTEKNTHAVGVYEIFPGR